MSTPESTARATSKPKAAWAATLSGTRTPRYRRWPSPLSVQGDSAVENFSEFFQRFLELNLRSSEQLDQLVTDSQRVFRSDDAETRSDSSESATPSSRNFAFKVRTTSGQIVGNIVIEAKDVEAAKAKLRRRYPDCEILERRER